MVDAHVAVGQLNKHHTFALAFDNKNVTKCLPHPCLMLSVSHFHYILLHPYCTLLQWCCNIPYV